MKYLFLLLTLSVFNASAQSGYKAGYIVTNEGDTIKGAIHVKEWNRNPRSIKFRASSSQEATVYNVDQLHLFEVPNYCLYRTYTGRVSQNKFDFNEISSGIDSTYKVDTIFLRSLIEAPYISLLVYSDDLKQRFFIRDKQSNLKELLSYRYRRDNNLLTFNPYKELLKKLVEEYHLGDNGVIAAIERSSYDKPSLVKTIRTINNLRKSSDRTGFRTITPFLGFSANMSKVNFEGNHRLAENSTDKTYVTPGFELGINLYPNPKIRKIAIRSSLTADKLKAYKSTEYELSPGRRSRTWYYLNSIRLSFSSTLQYNFYNGALLKTYLATGFVLSSHRNHESKVSNRLIETYLSSELKIPDNETEISWVRLQISLPVELGLQVKNLQLFAKHLYPIGNESFTGTYALTSKGYQGGIRYLLWRK